MNKKINLATHIFFVVLLFLSTTVPAGSLPDTGQTGDYTSTFGEDSDYTFNPPSYTKLDASGNDIPDSAKSWVMVRDNVTGLIWEVKSDNASSINYKGDMYHWQDTQDVFIAQINAENFGGFSDWRLPTIKELSYIVDCSRYVYAIDSAYFPGTENRRIRYWSSVTYANDTSLAWGVNYRYGVVYTPHKTITNYVYVRAVRGGQSTNSFADNGDGTITDTGTGLMWQQATAPGTYTWEQALTYCETTLDGFAGYDDWRLPNRNELQSPVDYGSYNPAIDTGYFLDTEASYYWSSTTNAYGASNAWHVDFDGGNVNNVSKSDNYYVRAVRGGQSGSPSTTTIPPTSSSTTTTISSGTTTAPAETTTTTSSIMSVSAGFIGTPVEGEAPLSVKFISSSSGTVTSYEWSFGDGGTSTEENPMHVYTAPGVYTASLLVSGPLNLDEAIKENYITVAESSLVADFSAEPTSGIVPLSVKFTDNSTGDVIDWYWDFGGGGTSTEQNPVHTYTQAGEYDVSLSVSDSKTTDSKTKKYCILVNNEVPSADFTADSVNGTEPLTVAFTEKSEGEVTGWYWNFGDGSISSEQNPEHTYTTPGTYTVNLTVTGPYGDDSEIKENLITVNPDTSYETFSISGTVIGAVNNMVTVYLFGETAERVVETDNDGYYTFEGLDPGEYIIIPVKGYIGFEPVKQTAELQDEDIYSVDFLWEPPGLEIAEVASSRSEVPDDSSTEVTFTARIKATGENSIQRVQLDLSPIGRYSKQRMYDDGTNGDAVAGDGIYSFKTTAADGISPGQKWIKVVAIDSTDQAVGSMIKIKVKNLVTGTVTDSKDNAVVNEVEGQTIIVRFSLSGAVEERKIRALEECSTLLDILKPDGTAYREDIPVTEDETEVEIDNAAAGSWNLRMRNQCPDTRQYSISASATGTGVIAGAVVNAATGDGLDNIQISTNAGGLSVSDEGYYMMLHVAGFYTLSAYSTDYLPATQAVAIQAGGSSSLDMALMPVPTTTTTVQEEFAVNFNARPTIGFTPLTVKFTNTSTGNIERYEWNFGDGVTSTEESPEHTYYMTDKFPVVLRAWTYEGISKSESKMDYIRVLPSLCILTKTLDDKNDLATLRTLRDFFLTKNNLTKTVAFLYYRHSSEISFILSDRPKLQYRLKELVKENIRIAEKLINAGETSVSVGTLNGTIMFLHALREEGSLELKNSIDYVIKGIEGGYLLKGIGISID